MKQTDLIKVLKDPSTLAVKDGVQGQLFKGVNSHEDVKKGFETLGAFGIGNFWVGAKFALYYIENIEGADMSVLEKDLNRPPKSLDIAALACKAFPKPNYNLDEDIYKLSAKALYEARAERKDLDILIQKATHEGWTSDVFKKELNKLIKGNVAKPDPVAAPKSSYIFKIPVPASDQDLDAWEAVSLEGFKEYLPTLRAKIAEFRKQTSAPLFDEAD